MKYAIKNKHEKVILPYKNDKNNIVFSKLYYKLSKTKEKIDNYSKKWDKAKKQANNYEYVYTSSNSSKNICKIHPVASRSYFKILEMVNEFELNIDFKNIICVAEGPGGFLQYLSTRYIDKNLYGVTLISSDKEIPYWSPLLLSSNNIKLLYGIDGDGDLYKLNNIESISNEIDKCELITADGGIDYSLNYNNQEILSYRLLYSEIITALKIQKEGGTFIIKFFDILHYNTIQLLYILYLCYEEIIIYKPNTSRFSNSEKYIICKKYTYNEDIVKLMTKYFYSYNNLNIYIPVSFIKEIQEYNEIYIKKQIENIELIINNINFNVNDNYIKKQLKYAKEWCLKYNLPINDDIII